VLILWGSVIEHRFPVQSWLTFRQALGLGGNVRKAEHEAGEDDPVDLPRAAHRRDNPRRLERRVRGT
jgi:hypothetical protein